MKKMVMEVIEERVEPSRSTEDEDLKDFVPEDPEKLLEDFDQEE